MLIRHNVFKQFDIHHGCVPCRVSLNHFKLSCAKYLLWSITCDIVLHSFLCQSRMSWKKRKPVHKIIFLSLSLFNITFHCTYWTRSVWKVLFWLFLNWLTLYFVSLRKISVEQIIYSVPKLSFTHIPVKLLFIALKCS